MFIDVVAQKRIALLEVVRKYMSSQRNRLWKGTSAEVQTALAQAWQKVNETEITDRNQMFSWLCKFIVNKCRDTIKTVRKRVEDMEKVADRQTALIRQSLESDQFEREAFEEIRKDLDCLNDIQWIIVRMKMDRFTHEQIGQALSPPVGASAVSDELRRIRKLMEEWAAAQSEPAD